MNRCSFFNSVLWVICIFPDLSIDTNDDHIESDHNGQNGLKWLSWNGIIWPQIWSLLVSMKKTGKMQITHENGIEETATIQKLWSNQNLEPFLYNCCNFETPYPPSRLRSERCVDQIFDS